MKNFNYKGLYNATKNMLERYVEFSENEIKRIDQIFSGISSEERIAIYSQMKSLKIADKAILLY